MTRLQSNPTEKLTEAKQWCIDARKLLKLSIKEREEYDLKSRASAVFDSLERLRSKLDPAKFKPLEQKFIEIATRIDQQAKDGNKERVALEAEQLNVLSKLLLKEEAAGNPKKQEKATKALVKAQQQLHECKMGMKDQCNTLLKSCQDQLNDLRTIKYVAVQTVETRIASAQQLISVQGKEDWPGAVDILLTVGGLVREAKTAAENWQKAEILHASAEDRYRSKQLKLTEIAAELKSKPGVETFIKSIEDAQKAGEDAIKKGPNVPIATPLYQDGYDAIIGIVPSTDKLLKAALSAAAKASKFIQNDDDIKLAEKAANDALEKLCLPNEELIGSTTESEYESKIARFVLLCGETGKKSFGLEALSQLTSELNDLHTSLTQKKSAITTLQNRVQELFDALLYDPTPEERAQLSVPLQLFQTGKTLFASTEFQAAQDTFTDLIGKLQPLALASPRTPDKYRETWETYNASGGLLNTTKTNLGKLKSSIEACQSKLQGSAELPTEIVDKFAFRGSYQEKLLGDIVNFAVKDHDYARAVKDLESFSHGIELQLTQQLEFQKSITKLIPEVEKTQQAQTAAQTSLTQVENKLKSETRPQGDTLADLKNAFASLKTEWLDTLAKMPSNLVKEAQNYAERFEQLKQKCTDIVSNPTQLTEALQAGVESADLKKFNTLVKDVNGLIKSLQQYSNTLASQHNTTLKNIQSTVSNGSLSAPQGHLAQITQLKETVTTAISTQTQERINANSIAKERYFAVKDELKDLISYARSRLGSRQANLFTEFFDSLEMDIRDLAGMLTSMSVQTIRDSLPELEQISRRIAKLRTEVKSSPPEGREEAARTLLGTDGSFDVQNELGIDFLFSRASEVTPDFRLVIEAVNLITKSLKDRNLVKCMPVHKAALDEDFKSLKKDIYTVDPASAFGQLRAFQARLSDALARAALANERRQDFLNVKLPAVEQKFQEVSNYPPNTIRGKLLKWKTEPKAYFLEIEQKIAAAKSLVMQPQKESTALTNLAKVDADLQAIINADATINTEELVARETAAQDRAFQQEKEAVQWEAKVKDFKRMDLARAKEAVSSTPGGDSSQIKDLERMLKQAEDIYSKTSNYVGAVELLNAAKQYAGRVQQHPQGLKTASRNELPKVLKHWKQGVTSFNNSVDTLVTAIQSADDDSGISGLMEDDEVEAAARKKIVDAVAKSIDVLNSLKTMFNATIFDAPIALLTSKQTTPRDKRAAKEQALKYVREYADLLRKDPILLRLMQKDRPFGTVDFYGLNAALRDLDLNLQRA